MSHDTFDAYHLLYPAFRAGLDFNYDRAYRGTENIVEGPAIYAANHQRFADSPLLAATFTQATGNLLRFGRPLRFAAKQEYFDGLGIDDKGKLGRPVKWFMEHTGMIPVDRLNTGPRSFQLLQDTVADRVVNGDSVALHPEGTRSNDSKIHKFKSGAARIAIALEVPIVPVGITYNEYDNKRRTHVAIEFGRPVTPAEYQAPGFTLLPGNAHRANHLIQIVENRVAAMTGLEQVGDFAILRKDREQK